MRAADARGRAGFTLLEVVAAMAILALFLVPLLGAITQGLRNINSIKMRTVALSLAQAKMLELETMPFPEAEETINGDFDDPYANYAWTVELVKTPEIILLETTINSLRGMEVHVLVSWDESGAQKTIQLNTLLLE